MAASEVNRILALVPYILDVPYNAMTIDYDREVDVLYISFDTPPSKADDAALTDDDVIIRYKEGRVVGMTILRASKRRADKLDALSHIK